MKERPILFSGAMVRAILDGRKTQTRRVVKPQPIYGLDDWDWSWPIPGKNVTAGTFDRWRDDVKNPLSPRYCPYGQPGDRLYVRETWAQPVPLDPGPTFYRADYTGDVLGKYENLPPAEAITWRPSIHMPRALSRIQLEVTAVRVERLNDCSEADAQAEGVEPVDSEREDPDHLICRWCGGTRLYDAISPSGGVLPDTDCAHCDTHVKRYQQLWDHINGADAWTANPWVWVVEFRRIEA
ncbi:hypothetical protein [Cupriavidus sp. CuC1]|uniref:hypothetical protein n=1 Tax=Cupriavidus sp. CuC1 TaxID=3373131 RepID=UPI0037D0A030